MMNLDLYMSNQSFLLVRAWNTDPKSLSAQLEDTNFSQSYLVSLPRCELMPASWANSWARPRSLSINWHLNPPSQSLAAGTFSRKPGTGLYVSMLQQRLEEAFMIWERVLASSPKECPIARAQDMDIIWIARAMLLQILAICPAPGLPQLKKFFPIASRIGFTLSNRASSGAPTKKVRVPAADPVTPPVTGASTQVILCCFADSARAAETEGVIVLLSMIRESGEACLKRPSLLKWYLILTNRPFERQQGLARQQ